MKSPFALLVLTLSVLLCDFESKAQLGTVATAQFSFTNSFRDILDPILRLSFGYEPTNASPIFAQFTFHTNDVGNVFSIDQFSDTNFTGFLSRATDGIDENVRETFTFGSPTGLQVRYFGPDAEGYFFSNFPYGHNGHDLSGFQIQRIDLTLNSLVINSPNTNETDFSIKGTLSFIGIVPVPVLSKPSYSGALGQFQFTFTGEPNATYVILSSTNFTDWLPIATNTSSLAERQITNSVSGNRTFFRVQPEPPGP